MIVVRAVD